LAQRKQIGNKKKERGNWWYLRGENHFAAQCYKKALEFLDFYVEGSDNLPGNDGPDVNELLDDRMKVYNNMAAAQMKLEQYDAALSSVDKVIKCQPNNTKALFRKGKILYIKNNIEESVDCMKKALDSDPNESEIRAELIKIQTKLKADIEVEKKLYRKMLSSQDNAEPDNATIVKQWVKIGVVFGIISAVVAAALAYKFKYDTLFD